MGRRCTGFVPTKPQLVFMVVTASAAAAMLVLVLRYGITMAPSTVDDGAYGPLRSRSFTALQTVSLRVLELNHRTRAKERRDYLSWINERVSIRDATLHDGIALSLLAPTHPCPFLTEKTPGVLVEVAGGKRICGVDVLPVLDHCIVYSFGSHNQDSFEREVRRLNPECEIHVFDPTSSPLEAWHYHSIGLSDNAGTENISGKQYKMTTIENVMREEHHSYIDILKMDIEGAEWRVMNGTRGLLEVFPRDRPVPVGQILVEIHDIQGVVTVYDFVLMLEKFEERGFRLVSIEPVCGLCKGQYEIGLFNMDYSRFLGD